MKLTAYLEREGLTFTEFARRAGTKYPRTIERVAKGQKVPGEKLMRAILKASGGEVTPNDFYDIPPIIRPSGARKPIVQAQAA